jgi:hypothetical protein
MARGVPTPCSLVAKGAGITRVAVILILVLVGWLAMDELLRSKE